MSFGKEYDRDEGPFLSRIIRGAQSCLTSGDFNLQHLVRVLSRISLLFGCYLSLPLLCLVFGSELLKLNLTNSWKGG